VLQEALLEDAPPVTSHAADLMLIEKGPYTFGCELLPIDHSRDSFDVIEIDVGQKAQFVVNASEVAAVAPF